jgi:uncharacterized protein YjiS (DUF1127 family)
MTDTAPAARAPRIARSFPRRAAVTLRLLWRAYWEYRVRRATAVILHKLDDRTLADIGVDRDEIDSLVDGPRAPAGGRDAVQHGDRGAAVTGPAPPRRRLAGAVAGVTAVPRFVSRDSARTPRARFPARARFSGCCRGRE